MKNILLKISSIAIVLLLLVGMNSCVKDEFDTPPSQNIPVGDMVTVADLLASATSAPQKVTEDKSLYGVITMGEQNGNLYKEAYMRDATGGIKLSLLSSTSLAVGDSVRIYMNGARYYNDNDQITIDSLETTYNLIKISAGKTVKPIDVTISDINTGAYIGQLIKLSGVQFINGELGKTYADAQALVTENRTIEDCTSSTIVRTSGYSNFAGDLIPEGNGTLIAIASSYRGTSQLYIRDVEEVVMNGERCGDEPGGSWEVNSSIKAVKDLYQGSRLQIEDELVFEATVTANDQFGNYYKTLVIQDSERGVEVKINDYDLFLTYTVGQKLLVSCKNLYLDAYGGVVQLGSVYDDNGEEKFGGIDPAFLSSHVQLADGGVALSPTVLEINNLTEDYLGMLIELQNVQFVDADLNETYADMANNYSANRTLTNCDGIQTIVRTSSYADFGGSQIAQGNGSFIGILSAYNGSYQFLIRDVNDLDMNGQRCDVGGGGGGVEPVDEINETFEGAVDYSDIAIDGWTTLNVQGDRNWQGKTYNTDKYAQATGYNSGLDVMETWLITPPVTNIGTKKLSLKTAKAFWAHTSGSPLTVLVSEDFDGENFETANWTEINPVLAGESDADNAWIESGDYDLTAFSGNAAIAFKYLGSGTESTSYRLDDIVVSTEGGSGGGGGGGGGGSTVDMIDEQFNSAVNYEDINLEGWVNVNVEGDRMWQGKEYDTEKYAQSTGYNSGVDYMECWLITPMISDIGSKSLSLKTAMAYWAHSGEPLMIMVSTDYDGENYASATWTEIDVTTASSSDSDHAWIDSGAVSLSAFSGDAAIAFKYVGSNTESTSIRLDDILVQ
ncbi:DUF5689 domain-containing protein [Lentimicrobium sp. S6]|uniref:DUF5689 domain-containing protein n=1 Tax=Lentimicrobium sp. S6 TaxID=2735872 RepID=UPI0015535B9B|nr:DUF5689 domain-containing protein [Lentimicrobium sp. S6]NPD46542.1 DUF5017 domain-containing protein [Lentimicrobium sp. S6]